MQKSLFAQRTTLFTAKLKCKAVFSCDFNGEDLFVFGGEDGFCEIFRLRESTLTKIAGYNAMRSVNSVRFSPNGQLIALGLSGGYVHIITIKGERTQNRKIHQGSTLIRKRKQTGLEAFSKTETSTQTTQEEHCFDVCWLDNNTVVSGGTDEMVYIWETGLRDNLRGIGKGMYFSTVNSLSIKRDKTIVARCSTCLVSFNDSNRTGGELTLLSSIGTRIPPHAEAETKMGQGHPSHLSAALSSSSSSSSSTSSSSSSSSSSSVPATAPEALLQQSIFLENGFQIRGGLSPDEQYYLCPSAKNPWSGESCTLVLDHTLESVVGSILLPRNEVSVVAGFCPRTFPLLVASPLTFPDAVCSYLFAVGTQTTLLLYTSAQLVPLAAIHADSPVTDLVWGTSADEAWVCATCLDGRVLFVAIPSAALAPAPPASVPAPPLALVSSSSSITDSGQEEERKRTGAL